MVKNSLSSKRSGKSKSKKNDPESEEHDGPIGEYDAERIVGKVW